MNELNEFDEVDEQLDEQLDEMSELTRYFINFCKITSYKNFCL